MEEDRANRGVGPGSKPDATSKPDDSRLNYDEERICTSNSLSPDDYARHVAINFANIGPVPNRMKDGANVSSKN